LRNPFFLSSCLSLRSWISFFWMSRILLSEFCLDLLNFAEQVGEISVQNFRDRFQRSANNADTIAEVDRFRLLFQSASEIDSTPSPANQTFRNLLFNHARDSRKRRYSRETLIYAQWVCDIFTAAWNVVRGPPCSIRHFDQVPISQGDICCIRRSSRCPTNWAPDRPLDLRKSRRSGEWKVCFVRSCRHFSTNDHSFWRGYSWRSEPCV
jgi:hypothetical protein